MGPQGLVRLQAQLPLTVQDPRVHMFGPSQEARAPACNNQVVPPPYCVSEAGALWWMLGHLQAKADTEAFQGPSHRP